MRYQFIIGAKCEVRIKMDFLEHKWVTSSEPAKATQQKKREQEYNHWYYQRNKDKWKYTGLGVSTKKELDSIDEELDSERADYAESRKKEAQYKKELQEAADEYNELYSYLNSNYKHLSKDDEAALEYLDIKYSFALNKLKAQQAENDYHIKEIGKLNVKRSSVQKKMNTTVIGALGKDAASIVNHGKQEVSKILNKLEKFITT